MRDESARKGGDSLGRRTAERVIGVRRLEARARHALEGAEVAGAGRTPPRPGRRAFEFLAGRRARDPVVGQRRRLSPGVRLRRQIAEGRVLECACAGVDIADARPASAQVVAHDGLVAAEIAHSNQVAERVVLIVGVCVAGVDCLQHVAERIATADGDASQRVRL